MRQKTVENRALDLRMPRRWVQAVFTYLGPGGTQPDANSSGDGTQAITSAVTEPPVAEHHSVGRGLDDKCVSDGPSSGSERRTGVAAAPGVLSARQQAEAADAASTTRSLHGSGSSEHEWDASLSEGVTGSDVGGLFQEPVRMVEEAVALGPGFTVQVRAWQPHTYVSIAAVQHPR